MIRILLFVLLVSYGQKQFILFFVDVYSKFNIDAFFPFVSYSVLVNILMLFSVLFYPLGVSKKIGFVALWFLFLFFGVVGLLFDYELFESSIWFINCGFVLFFVVFNRFRRSIVSLFGGDFRDNSLVFVSLLFVLQFVFFNIGYSLVVSVLFGLLFWYFGVFRDLGIESKDKRELLLSKYFL